jgi:hypothetical protein
MFRLRRFVRTQILKDDVTPRKVTPIPKERYLRQGDLISRRVSEVPKEVVQSRSKNFPVVAYLWEVGTFLILRTSRIEDPLRIGRSTPIP